MGNVPPKLVTALHQGKEQELITQLKKGVRFNASKSLGYEHWDNSAWHYICLLGMARAANEMVAALDNKETDVLKKKKTVVR